MNYHGPRNLLCRRKAALREFGGPAQRRWGVNEHAGHSQDCTHTSVTQRCMVLILQLLSTITSHAASTWDDLPVFSETSSSETEKHFQNSKAYQPKQGKQSCVP